MPSDGIGSSYANLAPTGSVRQDLAGIIYRVTPVDRPLSEMTSDGRASSKYHTWMNDALTVRQANRHQEGHQILRAAPNVPSVVGNWCQIVEKTWTVTESHEAMTHAGLASLVKHQMDLRSTELLTDIEHELWVSTVVTNNTAVTSAMQGLIALALAGSNASTIASGTSIGFDETVMNDMFQQLWENSNIFPSEVFVGAALRRRISGFTTRTTFFEPASSEQKRNTIGVYVSDFGTSRIHLCRDIPSTAGQGAAGLGIVMIAPQFFKKAWLRTIKAEPLPKLYDSYDGRCVAELTMEWGHANASGIRLGYS